MVEESVRRVFGNSSVGEDLETVTMDLHARVNCMISLRSGVGIRGRMKKLDSKTTIEPKGYEFVKS
jgi:hypothetical protein